MANPHVIVERDLVENLVEGIHRREIRYMQNGYPCSWCRAKSDGVLSHAVDCPISRLRAALDAQISEEMVEAGVAAFDANDIGYSIRLARLVDGVSTYTVVIDGHEPKDFGNHADAADYAQGIRTLVRVRAVLRAVLGGR